ncbi:MAG: DUF2330 domain-containing protein [Polyangiaceae bacterium]
MSRRATAGLLASFALLSSLALPSGDASACGGCFSGGGEPTIVTAHRMALSISTERTVLWDQIQYQGDPEEFAWVLPVRPGTTIELGSDAFFEALDAATRVNVFRPQNAFCESGFDEDSYYDNDDWGGGRYMGACSMTGCSAGLEAGDGRSSDGSGGGGGGTFGEDAPPDPVNVVHEESIGPYEAVILSSNEPGALYDWLLSHGYAIDASMEPTIDQYEAEGFYFVALRLIPGAGTHQMRPVRVTSPGAAPTLPLRMVAAGAGASIGLTLFMIGEGRWEASSFPNDQVDTSQLQWSFDESRSNYSELRLRTLGKRQGETWLTTYSKQGALLSPVYNPVAMGNTQYQASNGYGASTIADLYAMQGVANGEIQDTSCTAMFQQYANSTDKMVDPCADFGSADGGAGGAGGGMNEGGAMEGVGGAMEGVGGAMEGVGGAMEGVGGAMEGVGGAMEGVGGAMEGVGGATGAGGAPGAGGEAGVGGIGGQGARWSSLVGPAALRAGPAARWRAAGPARAAHPRGRAGVYGDDEPRRARRAEVCVR